jgi:cyclopropane fatty-acyl-phospholipid synthase-like methyltransferase
MLNWPDARPRKSTLDWTIRQLNLQPYQRLLEVGYGSGRLLAAVAGSLKSGFLAGTESSVPPYRQARRRNQLFLRQESMQLHLGQLHELPYPAHYFHTIYGVGAYYSWENTANECIRLAHLLSSGGRLVLFSRPGRYRKEEDLRTEVARLQASYLAAGLTDIRTDYRGLSSGMSLAVTGIKPELYDSDTHMAINNRLLNPETHFISKIARMQI